jgi:uncharacterized protein DUF2786/SprT-like family protein
MAATRESERGEPGTKRRGRSHGSSRPSGDAGALGAQLEAMALRAIRAEHRELNGLLFGSRLSAPSFTLCDSKTRLGQWLPRVRTIEISRQLLLEMTWGALVEVLKHEMAHQYVYEVLGAIDETAHGPAFRRVCAERGIDARATGAPVAGEGEASHEERSALEKIARLLTLASSPNEHEAQAAMAAAQRLMLKYNLEVSTKSEVRDYCFRHLGKPTGRVYEAQRILALILSEHFFVETIWVPVWRPLEGKRGSVIEVCGTRTNVEMADYAHDFLMQTSERLWREHKRAKAIVSNRDRRAFVAGVMAGFRDKLSSQKKVHHENGLVWRGDPALSAFLKQRHPRMHWTRHSSSRDSAAHAEGQRAGSTIVFHRGLTQATESRGRLLRS